MAYNKLMVIGRITDDLEVNSFTGKNNQSGSMVRFSLVSQKNKQAEPMYLSCVAFNKNAKNLKDNCIKGTQIFLEGELQPNNYIDKNGVKRNSFSVVVNKFVITQQPQVYWENRKNPQQAQQYVNQQPAPPQQAQQYVNQQPAPPQQTQQYGNQQWSQQYNDFFEC